MITITTTTGDHNTAERIATELVDRGLAACVQISGPVTSTYRWQGAVECDEEALLLVKTRAERLPELADWLRREHPYDTPECIAIEPREVEARYAAWLRAEVGAPEPGQTP